MKHIPAVLIIVPVLLSHGAAHAGTTVSVLRSDSREIVLDIHTDLPDIRTVSIGDRTYHELRIPGGGWTGEPGMPALPFAGALVGVPFDRDPVLEAEVLETKELGVLRILPFPTYRPMEDAASLFEEEGFPRPVPDYTPDPAAYASDVALPGRLAEIVSVSTLRFQRTAILRFYPVSYRPSEGRTVFHSRIRVRLDLRPGKGSEAPRGHPPPGEDVWERLYDRALVNPGPARAWARAPFRPPEPLPRKNAEPVRFRIRIDSTGVYRVSGEELQEAGLVKEMSVDSVALYQRGFDPDDADPFTVRPVPVEISDLDGDGRFDEDDHVIFFARSFREQWMQADWEDRFTDLNVYWLGVGESGTVRMDTISMPAVGCDAGTLSWTWRRSWFEEEHVFDYEPYGPEKDRTHWTHPNRDEVEVFFRLEDVHVAEPGSLRVRVEDAWPGDGTSVVSAVLRNPQGGSFDLGEFVVPDRSGVTEVFGLAAGILDAGDHALTLSGYRLMGEQQLPSLGSSLDWFEVGFPGSLTAGAGHVEVRTPPHEDGICLSIEDFGSPDVSLFDVSDPEMPRRVRLSPSDIEAQGGRYRLVVRSSPSIDGGRWVAAEEGAFRRLDESAIERVESASPAALEADYLVLCAEAFLEEVGRLAAWRESQGYAVGIVPISDVYDEFGSGFKSTDAIGHYLNFAFERWERKPQFVLLVGDASEDHRGVLEDSDPDWVPTENVRDWISYRAASDNRYACVDGDDLPDLFVGRLPVGSVEELTRQIDKILAYESGDDVAPWRQRVVLMADDSYSTDGYKPYTRMSSETCFEEVMQAAGAEVASSPACRADTFAYYLGGYTGRTDSDGYHQPCFQTADGLGCVRDSVYGAVTLPLTDRLNEGCLVFGYLGHGFRKGMAHELALADGVIAPVDGSSRWRYDVEERLLPTGRPFFCAGFGCLLANFHPPREAMEQDVLLEKFLNRAEGGAVACLGSSTSEVLHVENGYADAFFTSMFVDPPTLDDGGGCEWILGDLAVRTAARFLCDVGDAGAVERRILLGDPALRLRSRPLDFEVWVNGALLGAGEGIVVPADSATAGIVALLAQSLAAGPESLWVEIRDETGTVRLVRGVDYAVDSDTSSGHAQYAVRFDHRVRLADYRIVLGARAQSGGALEREIPVVFHALITIDGAPVSDGASVMMRAQGGIHLVLPWGIEAGSLTLVLSGADGEIPLHASVTAEDPERGNEWSLEFTLPAVPAGVYGLVLHVAGERLDLLRLALCERLRIESDLVYPSPFSEQADFVFRLSAGADVRVDIFTVAGHRVRTLSLNADCGYNALTWDGRDQEADRVANGTYLYRITARRGSEKVESGVGRVTVLR